MTQKNTNAIEMKHIVKKFGDFKANDDINLTLHQGEILALLGENGAGKSTLMRILSGLLEPTSGEIFVKGKKVEINSPTKAKEPIANKIIIEKKRPFDLIRQRHISFHNVRCNKLITHPYHSISAMS